MTQQTIAAPVAKNDINKFIIDTKVTPIYPVRYAYANFFEEELVEAVTPPSLSSMLGSTSINENGGYMLRLLREGWIHIREEDDEINGYWHIFKYEKIIDNNEIRERFTKYLFRNKLNAQDGLILDDSGRNKEYPFVFVRKNIKKVNILFAEHALHGDVIDRLNLGLTEREKVMQLVDLSIDSDEHSIPASADNFNQLIEDYKARQDRFLQVQDNNQPTESSLAIDSLTTEMSYVLTAEQIAAKLQKKVGYQKSAKIIALYDPVGRQSEIVDAHSKLGIWKQDFTSSNMYPYVIGDIVNKMKSDNESSDISKMSDAEKDAHADINESLEENINWDEHGEYWEDIDNKLTLFSDREKQFTSLYSSYMCGPNAAGIGSLSSYINNLFCLDCKVDEESETELQQICQLATSLFTGIPGSASGEQVMNEIIYHAAKDEDIDNVYYALMKSFRALVTQPQDGFNWNEVTSYAVDQFFFTIGSYWGKMVAIGKHASKMAAWGTKSSVLIASKYIADHNVPYLLKAVGAEANLTDSVRLTKDQIGKFLAASIDKKVSLSIFGRNYAINESKLRLGAGKLLFDWKEKKIASYVPEMKKLEETRPMFKLASTRFGIGASVTDKSAIHQSGWRATTGILADVNFAGVSLFFNAMVISDLSHQTKFSAADPLNKGNEFKDFLTISTVLTSLTLDTLVLSKAGVDLTKWLTTSSGTKLKTAQYLVPGLAKMSINTSSALLRVMGSKTISYLVVAANFAGVFLSGLEGIHAYQVGNRKAATGHALTAIGSGVLGIQALITGGSFAAFMGPIGLIGLALVAIGVGVSLYFSKSEFETLLDNCFWGAGPEYALWYEEDERPPVKKRLEIAIDKKHLDLVKSYYTIELQEFMNYMYMPKLVITKSRVGMFDDYKYDFKFYLPNFQLGVSNINVSLKTFPIGHNKALTKQFLDAVKTENIVFVNGIANLTVSITTSVLVDIHWSYVKDQNTIIPRRYLTDRGMNTSSVVGRLNEHGESNILNLENMSY